MKRGCVILLLIVLDPFVFSTLAQSQNRNGQTNKATTERKKDSAATNKDTEGPAVMKEVVVTATRYEEEIENVPANLTVITKEDIANSTAQDVPSILSTKGGVHVTDVTGNRRSYKVDLRGFGETAQSNTLVLVDGRRINEPDLSGTDWTLIPLDRVERIEIVRGSRGSVLYGDNATGGVVNIITKEGDKFKAGVNIAGGSYDAFMGDAYISGAQNNFSYALTGNYYDSDGYRENSATDAKDLGANLGYFVGDFMKLTLNSGYHKDETGLPGALRLSELEAGIPRTTSLFPDNFADTEDGYVGFTPELFFLQDSLFNMPLSYRKRDWLSFASFSGGAFEGDTEIKTTIASPQFLFKEPVFGFDNNLTFGLDYTKAKENIVNKVFGLYPSIGEFDLEKKNWGFYIYNEFYPIGNLALSAGYRYDKIEYHFYPSDPDNTDYDENPFTAGINYHFLEKSYLYFGFSEGFRYPVLDELFDFFSNTINTTLMPQTSKDYEMGVRHFFTQSLYTNINFFRLDTKDEIYFNPTGGPFGFGANENFDGETRRQGVEISLGKTFKRVSLVGTYTYTNAEVLNGPFAGNEVPGVPKNMATFVSDFDIGRGFNFIFNGKYVGKRFLESDWANAFPEQDDYVVFNAKLKYKWKKITAYFDVNNLFDEDYASFGVLSLPPVEPAFFPSPERNFLVGVRFDY
jgi:iron complex outermembrane receptor protein